MSYILEALRKSEQERNQSRVVGNPQGPPLMVGRSPGKTVAWWLLPLVILNLSVLGYLFWHNGYNARQPDAMTPETPETPETPDTAPEAAFETAPPPSEPQPGLDPAPEPVGSPARSTGSVRIQQPPDATWDTVPLTPPGEAVASPERTPEKAVPERSGRQTGSAEAPSGVTRSQPRPGPREDPVARDGVPLLVDLPAEFRRQVPDLVFNSHVYSSAPGSRRVIINQQYLAEGDRVGPLRLLEITPGGVILSLNNTSFAVPVVHDWIQPRR